MHFYCFYCIPLLLYFVACSTLRSASITLAAPLTTVISVRFCCNFVLVIIVKQVRLAAALVLVLA